VKNRNHLEVAKLDDSTSYISPCDPTLLISQSTYYRTKNNEVTLPDLCSDCAGGDQDITSAIIIKNKTKKVSIPITTLKKEDAPEKC